MKNKLLMKNENGFTLIEVIVVAGIIAILAGILVPLILKEIDESRITRAYGDVKSISSAILVFKKDTAQWPALDETCNPNITLLSGSGSAPGGLGANNWDNSLERTINEQLPEDANGCYNNWKGSYIPYVSADPWGNRYVINADKFADTDRPVWIMSAGPNETIDTNAEDAEVAGDDVGLRIQ